MKRYVLACLCLISLVGCSIDQKAIMGANGNREEGFSGYGVSRARAWEGPIMDIVVPDDAPMGITDSVQYHGGAKRNSNEERNLGFRHQGIHHAGERIGSNRPGLIQGKPSLEQNSAVHKQSDDRDVGQPWTKEQDIRHRIENIEGVDRVYLLSNGGRLVIGLEAHEPSRTKLERDIHHELNELIDPSRVTITLKRTDLNRMKELEKNVNQPADERWSDIPDLFQSIQH